MSSKLSQRNYLPPLNENRTENQPKYFINFTKKIFTLNFFFDRFLFIWIFNWSPTEMNTPRYQCIKRSPCLHRHKALLPRGCIHRLHAISSWWQIISYFLEIFQLYYEVFVADSRIIRCEVPYSDYHVRLELLQPGLLPTFSKKKKKRSKIQLFSILFIKSSLVPYLKFSCLQVT